MSQPTCLVAVARGVVFLHAVETAISGKTNKKMLCDAAGTAFCPPPWPRISINPGHECNTSPGRVCMCLECTICRIITPCSRAAANECRCRCGYDRYLLPWISAPRSFFAHATAFSSPPNPNSSTSQITHPTTQIKFSHFATEDFKDACWGLAIHSFVYPSEFALAEGKFEYAPAECE